MLMIKTEKEIITEAFEWTNKQDVDVFAHECLMKALSIQRKEILELIGEIGCRGGVVVAEQGGDVLGICGIGVLCKLCVYKSELRKQIEAGEEK